MTVFDVVLNTDDIVVLGPPQNIDVSIALGEQGVRGSTFFAGAGNPNDTVVSQNIFGTTTELKEGDVYINVSSGSEYGWLYIYNPKVVGNQWDEVLRLQPPFYATTLNKTFVSGTTTVSIPISNILPTGITNADPNSYIISFAPQGSDVIALTVVSKSIVASNFEFVVKGIKYSSSTWSNLSGSVTFDINITVV
jgi:hypothetical protein